MNESRLYTILQPDVVLGAVWGFAAWLQVRILPAEVAVEIWMFSIILIFEVALLMYVTGALEWAWRKMRANT